MPKKGEGKRKREPKDPNAPKKPLTGYMTFCQEERENIKSENPEMKAKEIMSELGNRWKSLSEAEKKKYNDQYKAAKAKYDEEMKKYKAEKGEESEEEKPQKKKKAASKRSSKKKKKEEEEEEEEDNESE
jgi:hypothetical protein